MDRQKVDRLINHAVVLRKTALTMIYNAHSGHPGGSLSAADIVTALYFDELNIDPAKPRNTDRDRFILSKGHVCPILYSALILRNFIPPDSINQLRKYGSILQGHPDMKRTPGIDISTGSLGQGLSAAVGMAIAGKRDNKSYRVFTLLGDGECDEGQIWEAVQSAVKYKLDNLVIFIDNNGLQNDGPCDAIMPTLDLEKKFDAFGCAARTINGHKMEEILAALDSIRNLQDGKPKAIIAKTVKGRGVTFMENAVEWHGMAPNKEQYEQAILEIERGLM